MRVREILSGFVQDRTMGVSSRNILLASTVAMLSGCAGPSMVGAKSAGQAFRSVTTAGGPLRRGRATFERSEALRRGRAELSRHAACGRSRDQLPPSSRRWRAITIALNFRRPSKMLRMRASHKNARDCVLSAKPLPPWICSALSADAQATRAEQLRHAGLEDRSGDLRPWRAPRNR